MGIEDIASVVEHDVTADTVFKHLPEAGTVDVITMSYSFSMIPDQAGVVRSATKLLRKGGYLALADFFLEGNFDSVLSPLFKTLRKYEALFHKNWFALDHVHLLADKHLESVIPSSDLEVVWDNRFRGAVPFLPFLQPYHGVYILKKK